ASWPSASRRVPTNPRSTALDELWDLAEKACGERGELVQHPVAGQQQRDTHADRLRYERKRRFPYLRRGLGKRHREADEQRGQQDRSGQLSGDRERFQPELDHLVVGHSGWTLQW